MTLDMSKKHEGGGEGGGLWVEGQDRGKRRVVQRWRDRMEGEVREQC